MNAVVRGQVVAAMVLALGPVACSSGSSGSGSCSDVVAGDYYITYTAMDGQDSGACNTMASVLGFGIGTGYTHMSDGAPVSSDPGCEIAQSGCTFTQTCEGGDAGIATTETVTANASGTGGSGTRTATSSSTALIPDASCSWQFTFSKL